jgi:hypothetical protein
MKFFLVFFRYSKDRLLAKNFIKSKKNGNFTVVFFRLRKEADMPFQIVSFEL